MKHQVGTSLEDAEMQRVRTIVDQLHVSEAWVIRRAVLRGLREVEREVLGASGPEAKPDMEGKSDPEVAA